MNTIKKRPTKLQIEVNLVNSTAADENHVIVGQRQKDRRTQTPTETEPKKLSGEAKIRREVKGRAGKPVTVIYDFSDLNAKHPPTLKHLQGVLKERLACGGTFEPDEARIVLQVDDPAKVRAALSKLGFSVKG